MNIQILVSRSLAIALVGTCCSVVPVLAQIAGGNDNGSGLQSISAPLRRQAATNAYVGEGQAAVDRYSRSLAADSIGHPAIFEVINGGEIAPLVTALLPDGIAAKGSTATAANNLAKTLKGMRANDAKIDAAKLNASVAAYNNYVKALVDELGSERALANPPVAQQPLQNLLSKLLRTANQAIAKQSEPAAAPSAARMPLPADGRVGAK